MDLKEASGINDAEFGYPKLLIKYLKFFVGLCTGVYVVLYPFCFIGAFFSFMIFASPRMTMFSGLLCMTLAFCLPVSMVVSTHLVWSRFHRKHYGKSLLFLTLPWINLGVMQILPMLVKR
jgi:hypothetical protein